MAHDESYSTLAVRADILQPYWDWHPCVQTLLKKLQLEYKQEMNPDRRPDVFVLNGPAGSGKSLIANTMKELLHCNVMRPTDALYAAMQVSGLPATEGLSYQEFKALPYGRERLIAASEGAKAKVGPHIWLVILTAMTGFYRSQGGGLVIIDNVGFQEEIEFLAQHARVFAGAMLLCHYVKENQTFEAHDVEDGAWVGDSRGPVQHPNIDTYVNSTVLIQAIADLTAQKTVPATQAARMISYYTRSPLAKGRIKS